MEGLGETFRVNIWDFGGRRLPRHPPVFLTKRSLYARWRYAQRGYRFYYWLNVVELLV
jgi:hypothetical protein